MERAGVRLFFCSVRSSGSTDDPAWDHSVFSKNSDRLLEGDIAAKLIHVLDRRSRAPPQYDRASRSRRHADRSLGVDEELRENERTAPRNLPLVVEATARRTSATEKQSNKFHTWPRIQMSSSTAKGRARRQSSAFMGHGLIGNNSVLLVGTCLTPANGHAPSRFRRSPWMRAPRQSSAGE